jgi:hypothetical protein
MFYFLNSKTELNNHMARIISLLKLKYTRTQLRRNFSVCHLDIPIFVFLIDKW